MLEEKMKDSSNLILNDTDSKRDIMYGPGRPNLMEVKEDMRHHMP